jgi:hypothetical protein
MRIEFLLAGARVPDAHMPSLLRFLAVVGIIAGIGYGIIFALAYLTDPKPREISVTVPPDRFYKQR